MSPSSESSQQQPGDGARAATRQPADVQQTDLSAQFQIPLDDDNVTPLDLLEADIWQSPLLTKDPDRLEVGEEYYPKLRAALDRKHEKAEVAVSSTAGMVLSLGIGGPDEFEILVNSAILQFNWTEPRRMLLSINELANEAKRWISSPDERHGLLVTLFGIASQIQSSIARENELVFEQGGGETTNPSALLKEDLDLIESQMVRARQQFLDDAQRAAQLRYAKGMAYGGLALGVLACMAGLAFLHWEVAAVNGVGLLAGAVGAGVSVLQRMTSGTLVLNFQTVARMLVAFGALRPFIGGIFGLLTFCVLKANLVSAIVLPTDPGQQLAFVTVFAFAAGFNERFFQDMLAEASRTRVPTQEPAPDPNKPPKAAVENRGRSGSDGTRTRDLRRDRPAL